MVVHEKSPSWVTFRGQKCPRDVTKNVHEMSPSKNVHEMSPNLKKSVHEMSLSTKWLHPPTLASELCDATSNMVNFITFST